MFHRLTSSAILQQLIFQIRLYGLPSTGSSSVPTEEKRESRHLKRSISVTPRRKLTLAYRANDLHTQHTSINIRVMVQFPAFQGCGSPCLPTPFTEPLCLQKPEGTVSDIIGADLKSTMLCHRAHRYDKTSDQVVPASQGMMEATATASHLTHNCVAEAAPSLFCQGQGSTLGSTLS